MRRREDITRGRDSDQRISPEAAKVMAWACPECMAEIEAGRGDTRFGTFTDVPPFSPEITDDGERLYVHCPRHCRLLLDAPLSAIRTGADRTRERLRWVAA